MADHEYQGVVMTSRDGELIDVRCDGVADRDTALPWSARTPSQIASISKQFAAVIALLLADRGVIAFEDPLRHHLPRAPLHWDDVSLRQLITHTAGVSHWSERRGFVPSVPMDAGERLALLLEAPLLSTPGSEWRYSSPGYLVLASALAAAADQPYTALVGELIIDRLGLDTTTAGAPAVDGAAMGYHGSEPVEAWELHSMAGTGDLWSSAADLLRFVTALHTGALLPDTQQDVFRGMDVSLPSQAPQDEAIRTTAYGCGHFLGTIHGAEARLHPGDNPGYLSLAAWLPRSRTAVVALSNDETCDIEKAVADAVTDVSG